jgi:hypothetical protein
MQHDSTYMLELNQVLEDNMCSTLAVCIYVPCSIGDIRQPFPVRGHQAVRDHLNPVHPLAHLSTYPQILNLLFSCLVSPLLPGPPNLSKMNGKRISIADSPIGSIAASDAALDLHLDDDLHLHLNLHLCAFYLFFYIAFHLGPILRHLGIIMAL